MPFLAALSNFVARKSHLNPALLWVAYGFCIVCAIAAPNAVRDAQTATFQESQDALDRSQQCYRLASDPPIIKGSIITSRDGAVLRSGFVCSLLPNGGDTGVIGADGKVKDIKRIRVSDLEQFKQNIGGATNDQLQTETNDV